MIESLENTNYIIATSQIKNGTTITAKIDVYKRGFKIFYSVKKFFFFRKRIEVEEPIISICLPIAKIVGDTVIIDKIREKMIEIRKLLWEE